MLTKSLICSIVLFLFISCQKEWDYYKVRGNVTSAKTDEIVKGLQVSLTVVGRRLLGNEDYTVGPVETDDNGDFSFKFHPKYSDIVDCYLHGDGYKVSIPPEKLSYSKTYTINFEVYN